MPAKKSSPATASEVGSNPACGALSDAEQATRQALSAASAAAARVRAANDAAEAARPRPAPSCATCGALHCHYATSQFPGFCLTVNTPEGERKEAVRAYTAEGEDAKIARAAAEVEGTYYGSLTRAEEIVAFANRIGARKIGIATCVGLIEETKIFAKVLRANDLVPYAVLCKVGAVDKCEIGIPPELKVNRGAGFEALCNPVLQAKVLNKWGAELFVVVGLCVGHDSLFIKYAKGPVTTLITKDRVTGHNPAAALYGTHFYFKRLLETDRNL
jgi:uncharacterized metal-binding protein